MARNIETYDIVLAKDKAKKNGRAFIGGGRNFTVQYDVERDMYFYHSYAELIAEETSTLVVISNYRHSNTTSRHKRGLVKYFEIDDTTWRLGGEADYGDYTVEVHTERLCDVPYTLPSKAVF
jgi:hypothetical protein